MMKKTQKSNFRLALSYMYESRYYFIFSFFVFLVSAFFGFIFSSHLHFLDDLLRELADKVSGKSTLELVWFIFQNNASSAFFALMFGVFVGILPFFNALLNGVLLGYVLSYATVLGGYEVIWRLAPHGIFELPAIFIAIGLGIKLGMSFFSRSIRTTLFYRFTMSLYVFFFIVIPLLVIAAIIEGLLISCSLHGFSLLCP